MNQKTTQRKSGQAHIPHSPPLLDNTTHNEWQDTHLIHQIIKKRNHQKNNHNSQLICTFTLKIVINNNKNYSKLIKLPEKNKGTGVLENYLLQLFKGVALTQPGLTNGLTEGQTDMLKTLYLPVQVAQGILGGSSSSLRSAYLYENVWVFSFSFILILP